MNHFSDIQSLVEEVRQKIPTILASTEADAYLKANIEKGEENVVVIIVGLKPITPEFSRGRVISADLDKFYGLIEQAVLEKAKDHGIDVQPVRKNW